MDIFSTHQLALSTEKRLKRDKGRNGISMSVFKSLFLLFVFVSPITTATNDLLPETYLALKTAERLYENMIFVTSAYRTPEHNLKVGGSPKSYHLSGEAVDVRMPNSPAQLAKLVWAMSQAGFKGFGLYSDHVHFDMRSKPTFWRVK